MKKFLIFMIVLLLAIGFTGFAIKKGYLKKEEVKYVTFSYDDGIYENYKCKIKESKINCMVIEPSNPKAEFMGWYDSDDNKVDIEGDFTEEVTLHPRYLTDTIAEKAKKTEKKHIITFNMNGGIGNISKIEVEYEGQLYALKKLPTRSGYTFLGFYDNKDYNKGKQYYNENGESIRNFDKASNTTLYAGWSKDVVKEIDTPVSEIIEEPVEEETNEYKITFNSNGGTGGQSGSITNLYGESLPEIETKKPVKNGYDFMGWYDNANWTKGTQYYNKNGISVRKYYKKNDLILYAGWEEEQVVIPEPIPEPEPMAEEAKYTVSFDANHGSGGQSTPVIVKYGESMPSIAKRAPTRNDYTFMGWYDNPDWTKGTGYYKADGSSARTYNKKENIKLYAGWEKKEAKITTYTVAFNANGGTGGQSVSVKATYGSAMPTISTTAPTRIGYSFMGWYDNSDYTKGTQYYTKSCVSAKNFDKKSAVTLYAGWKANIFNVAYNANGGTGTTSSQTCTYDGICTLKANAFRKSGYTFIGWKKDNTGTTIAASSSIKNVVSSGTVTYYAQWAVVKYTVAFNANGGTGGQSVSVKATYGSAMPTISTTAPTRIGYSFMGWYDNSDYTKGTQYYTKSCVSAKNFDKKSAVTLYAGWKANIFNVAYNANGGTGTTSSQTCTYDGICTLKANAFRKSGYTFIGWKKDNTGTTIAASSSIKNVVSSGTVTYYAQWEARSYMVSFNANGGTGGQSTNVTATPDKAMPAISTTAPTKTGYTFMGWYDNSNYTKGTQYYTKTGASARNFNKTSNITLYAGWKAKTFTASFDLNNGTGTKPSNVTVTYDSAMPKLNSTTPSRSGYTFKGWYDKNDYTKGHKYYNIDGTSARPYDKVADITLYAGWEQNKVTTYTVTFNKNGGSGGQSVSVKATYGSAMPTISTIAPTKSDHIFLGWYDNKNFKTGIQYYTSDGKSARKYDVKGDITLYAGWLAADTFIVKYNCNGGTGTIESDTFKKGNIFVPKVNTCTKEGYNFEKWSPYKTAINSVNWTFKNIDNYAENGKYSIKNNIITLYARWIEKKTSTGTQKLKLTSKTLVDDCAQVIGTRNWNYNGKYDIYCKYESPTLKYYIERPYQANMSNYNSIANKGIIITQIWIKDFAKQLKVAISPVDSNYRDGRRKTWRPDEIIENEIKTKKYSTKGLFGVNASPMVSDKFYTKAPMSWRNSPALEYWKNNGEVLRNAIDDSYSKALSTKIVYGISKDGEFKHYKMSRDDSKKVRVAINNRIAEYIENDGIKDTFTWRPILIDSGVKTDSNSETGQIHGFCQIDKNNYVVITTMVPPNRDAREQSRMRANNPTSSSFMQDKMLEYGCQYGVLFDGGGSIATFSKKNTADSFVGPGYAHDYRTGADVLYFVEQ